MRYRKKPIIIEAHRWFKNGDHPEDGGSDKEGKVVKIFDIGRQGIEWDSICSECGKRFTVHGWIDTLEDGHRVCPGDYIITGIKGERYPVKPDIFELTYEVVK